ncbi:MAG: hypothetical protein NT154_39590 [Verrucomicrobia bacterium]|nr:hypothetical protein [Verrucomicrobiota bacterium]
MFGYRLVRSIGCLVAALWTPVAPACNVPVFRYALERWEADPYQIVVFHNEPLAAEQQALVEMMEKRGQDGLANLAVNRVDLAHEVPLPLRELWDTQKNPALPWMVLRYPRPTGIQPSAWAGPLSAEAVGSLVESSARRDIAQKLLSGDAVVWLLLEGGDKKRDDQAAQLVETELRNLETSLVLPERSPLDLSINPELPLKIAFATLRVAHSDPAERMLVNLLLNWKTNLTTDKEPMLFPIFGRGRVVSPAIGSEIRPEAIRDMAEFLTGPCSCEVKEMNPGYDLLLAANWSALPGYQEEMLPPPLVGISQFAAAAATNTPAPSSPPSASLAAVATSPTPAERDPLGRNLVALLGLGVVFLAITTLVLKAKAGRAPH